MTDWTFAQTDPSEELAKLHLFSIKKRQSGGDVEFRITVREYAERTSLRMRFFAQADKQVNQKTAAFVPFGWGESLLHALGECIKQIHQFPYDDEASEFK